MNQKTIKSIIADSRKIALSFLFILGIPVFMLAQNQRIVTGTVTDAAGEPIIGVNVLEKGTSNGNITDFDGKYSIRVSANATLTFSFIGYIPQEVAVNNRSTIDVSMKEDTQTLDEVVVVGYGTMQKKQLTSSITSLSAKNLPQGVGGSSIAPALAVKVLSLKPH